MKILLVTASYRPSINGVAISVASLKINLEKMGHSVLVLAPKNKESKIREAGVVRYPATPNPLVPDYPIPLSPITVGTLKRVTRFKPDVVHVHHPFHIGFFARLLADKFRVPLVFTYHTRYGYYTKKYFGFLPDKLKSQFVANNVYDFCNKVDLIIAPSQEIGNLLLRRTKNKNIVVLPSVVDDLKKTGLTKDKLRYKYKLSKDKKILLAVTRLSVEKNPQLLIVTLKKLPPNFILVICGTGPLEKDLKSLINKNRLKRRVYMVGKIKRDDLSGFYQMADYFINSSASETQGLVFWEAEQFGLPIVSVTSNVAKEWTRDGFGILAKGTVKDMAGAVEKIARRDRNKMSKSALIFSGGFTTAKYIKKMIKLYSQAIKNNND